MSIGKNKGPRSIITRLLGQKNTHGKISPTPGANVERSGRCCAGETAGECLRKGAEQPGQEIKVLHAADAEGIGVAVVIYCIITTCRYDIMEKERMPRRLGSMQ